MNKYLPPRLIILLAILTALIVIPRAAEDKFNPRTVIDRAFPPIKDPRLVKAAEAGKVVRDDELVLGVVVKGKARAYPINMLTGPRREIINDKLGGQAIAATW